MNQKTLKTIKNERDQRAALLDTILIVDHYSSMNVVEKKYIKALNGELKRSIKHYEKTLLKYDK